jgi:hypothetical protein
MCLAHACAWPSTMQIPVSPVTRCVHDHQCSCAQNIMVALYLQGQVKVGRQDLLQLVPQRWVGLQQRPHAHRVLQQRLRVWWRGDSCKAGG